MQPKRPSDPPTYEHHRNAKLRRARRIQSNAQHKRRHAGR